LAAPLKFGDRCLKIKRYARKSFLLEVKGGGGERYKRREACFGFLVVLGGGVGGVLGGGGGGGGGGGVGGVVWGGGGGLARSRFISFNLGRKSSEGGGLLFAGLEGPGSSGRGREGDAASFHFETERVRSSQGYRRGFEVLTRITS